MMETFIKCIQLLCKQVRDLNNKQVTLFAAELGCPMWFAGYYLQQNAGRLSWSHYKKINIAEMLGELNAVRPLFKKLKTRCEKGTVSGVQITVINLAKVCLLFAIKVPCIFLFRSSS